MKIVLSLFVIFGLHSLTTTTSNAHTMGTRATVKLQLNNAMPSAIGIQPTINSASIPLFRNRFMGVMELNKLLIMSDSPQTVPDTSAIDDSVTSSWTGELSSEFGSIASMIIDYLADWFTKTVVPYISNAVSEGISEIGGSIKSAFSWLGTRHKSGVSTLSTPSDSSQVAADGVLTTGDVVGSRFAFLLPNPAYGALIVPGTGYTQTTTYTIPNPGTATASFVLDQGDQSLGGKRSFSGTVNISSLAASEAVVTNASKDLVSLGYGSSNTASTLVERDVSGNFSAGEITVTHLVSSGSVGSSAADGTVVTTATAVGTDVVGTITLSTAAHAGSGTVTVTFGKPYAAAPIVMLTPANAAAQVGGTITAYFVTGNTGNFVLTVADNGTATSNAKYNYMIVN